MKIWFGLRCLGGITGLWVAGLAFTSPPAQGSLVISNTAIVNARYVYELTYERMTNSAAFNADVFSTSNVVWGALGPTRYIRTFDSLHERTTNKFAEVVYRFDFTATDFLPLSMTIRDNLATFRNHDPNEHTLATTAWSTNGVDYILVNQLASPVAPVLGTGVVADVSVNLPSRPSLVYYRVVFTNFESGFNEDQAQWNRVSTAGADTTSCFRVSFATNSVPGRLTISKLQARLNFTKLSNDTCSVTATLDLGGAGDNLTNKVVALDIGGAQRSFTLDSKGKGRALASIVDNKGHRVSIGTCRLAYTKPRMKPARPGFWTLTATMNKGTWRDPWNAYGLHNDNISAKASDHVTLPVLILINDEPFANDTKVLKYTASLNKAGMAK